MLHLVMDPNTNPNHKHHTEPDSQPEPATVRPTLDEVRHRMALASAKGGGLRARQEFLMKLDREGAISEDDLVLLLKEAKAGTGTGTGGRA